MDKIFSLSFSVVEGTPAGPVIDQGTQPGKNCGLLGDIWKIVVVNNYIHRALLAI